MNPLQSLRDYERFIYTLQQRSPDIRRTTLTIFCRGANVARLAGEIEIGDYRLVVREKVTFTGHSGKIIGYGYEVWRGQEKLFWYDSQEHPNDPALASTHPHHKHIAPDIKHHRIPAPGLSFTEPNLPSLIREIEMLVCGNATE